jgi:hypothetical protein
MYLLFAPSLIAIAVFVVAGCIHHCTGKPV